MPGSLPQLDLSGGGSARPLSGAAALAQAKRAGIDIGAVIETVGHRVEPVPGTQGLLRSQDRLYRADFGSHGFALTLRVKPTKQGLAATRSSRPAEATLFERASSFTIETSAASRGGQPLGLAAANWRSWRNTARRTLATGLDERVTARDGKLEWDFLLQHPLPGSGALTIEARVGATGEPQRLRHAWRWPVGGGRQLRMGELRVKDAAGRELYRALPAVSARGVALEVPGSVLGRAAYPVTVDPVISPEYPVSSPVYTREKSRENGPSVAFGGSNYLVAWNDYRNESSLPHMYAARVSTTNNLLDPAGIAIRTALGSQSEPEVGFDGSNYLVVWSDYSSNRQDFFDVYGAHVTPAGAVLEPGGFPISPLAGRQRYPGLAFDGTNYLVAWSDETSDDISGTRVSPSGTVLDPAGIPISTAPDFQRFPAVAFNGTNYLVAWADRRSGGIDDTYASRVTTAGTALDPAGIAVTSAAGASGVDVASDGTNYLVSWTDFRSGVSRDVYGARIGPTGAVLDPAGIPISTAASDQVLGALAFDGTNYFAVWGDRRSGTSDAYGARVTPAGSVLDPAGIVISTGPNTQAPDGLAFDGVNYLVSWSDDRTGSLTDDVYVGRVSPAGTVLDPSGTLVSTIANNQTAPALAFDGTNYLVVWQDFRSLANPNAYAARVSSAGALLDGTGIALASATNAQYAPSVAFDGTNYLAVFGGGCAVICGVRVSTAGTVLDPGGIPISPSNGAYPAIAFGGTNYLVVWEDVRSSARGHAGPGPPPPTNIFGARVSQAGSLLDPAGIPISTAVETQASAAVASNGTNYLVVWQDSRATSGTTSDIYGARVAPTGSVLDPVGIAISPAANQQLAPAIASNGTDWVVAWGDNRFGTNYNLYGARVSAAGSVVDPGGIPLSTATDDQTVPALAFDGTTYTAVWEDRRSGTNYDLYGTRITTAGAVLDPGGLAVATSGADERAPALASASLNRVALSYQRFATESPYGGANRIGLRFVDNPSANDDWAQAEDISAGFGSRSSVNTAATGEAGEPNHGGVSLPLNSVWYKFSFPVPTVVQLDTCGSALDTVLAVYTGSSVGSLTPVTSNNDSCGQQSRVLFRAAAGVVYTAAVDGYGSAVGAFTLNFTKGPPSHPRPVNRR